MKELSIEEKAHRYDEAIEVARKINSGDGVPTPPDWTTCEVIFPELRESEDERIRKHIIEILSSLSPCHFDGNEKSECIAWLEKQKTTEEALQYLKENHSPSEMSDFQSAMNIAVAKAYNKGYADGLEKQGEQKPADKVESISKDDDDESIRKDIIAYMRYERKSTEEEIENRFIPWLEKQGEPKPADKVEPKFNVGDWVVCCNYEPEQIIGIRNDMYEMSNGDIRPINMINNNHNIRLWSIQDAKDGDVLSYVTDEGDLWIMIYKSLYEHYEGHVHYHALIFNNDFTDRGTCFIYINNLKPATKEQRDILFQKIKEAGYEWDAKEKELRKIERKPEIKDDVLSRFAFYQYDDDTIYLSSLFVRESDRKCGHGSKVLKAAEEVAKTFGISKIRLKVERNTWMEKWYEKNGYEYISSEGKYNWLENRVIDIKPNKIEQKPADKVEPKFNVGDWILIDNPCKIISIDNYGNYLVRYWDFDAIDKLHTLSKEFCESYFHLWTIRDAKDGDVLCIHSSESDSDCIFLYQNTVEIESGRNVAVAYCGIDVYANRIEFGIQGPDCIDVRKIKPVTQEQRDLLFQKIKEAGYEWDGEKKELKRIEQEEKEDGIISDIISVIEEAPLILQGDKDNMISWLKSLKERYTWKPSDEQMKLLKETCDEHWEPDGLDPLYTLYQDLKELKRE